MGDKEKNRTDCVTLYFSLLMLSSHLVLAVIIPLISMMFCFVSYQQYQNELCGVMALKLH